MNREIICIDLKSFYASVECVERDLDPFKTNLVVADPTRGSGTVCLAVSPKMKMLGVKNRCRIFEIPQNIRYIKAKPRMSKYIEYSANIYSIYLKYVSKDDIHVYSIDEAFLDVTEYLKIYKMNSLQLAKKIITEIYNTYKITATAGVGTNLYLAKIALDILAKHNVNNIGYLDENRYKECLWHHRPLSDFWQIGKGIEKRLNKLRIYDMYDLAHSNYNKLYKEFGINAELLIDHAYGRESCTISDIKSYNPKSSSISTNQVLFEDYSWDKARLVLKEMVEVKSLELIEKGVVTDIINLYIGYSKDCIKATGGKLRLPLKTNVYSQLLKGFLILYDKTTSMECKIRRIGISFENIQAEENIQLNFFVDDMKLLKEKKVENAILNIKNEMGKNCILRGMSFEDGATAKLRNTLIGGHNA